jgi:hypothetical protein
MLCGEGREVAFTVSIKLNKDEVPDFDTEV